MKQSENKYPTVSIPRELYETVRTIVKFNPQYTSISEFVKESIREKISQSIKIQQELKRIKS